MSPRRAPLLRLFLMALLAVLVHGYHLGADDAAIYVPAIKKAADPALYPFGAEFFMSHAHLSFFPDLVGGSARLTRLPVNFAIFAWHVAGIFLLLLAAWRLVCACFHGDGARWGGVALLAALLSVPVAGTALAIMDPYLTARSLSTPATLFAIACYVSGKPKSAVAWLLGTALIHPQMSAYGAVFLTCLACAGRRRSPISAAPAPACGVLLPLPFLFEFQPARGAAREALYSRTYFFVFQWAWYEWVGVFAPLALLWWWSSAARRGTTPVFRTLSRTLLPFGLLFTAAGVLLNISARLENYTRLQPMRAFHLVYVVFFVLLGGLLGEYLLAKTFWRWLALFAPLAVAMWLLQQTTYPASPHVEWPGYVGPNSWISAFVWIRDHTPRDAVFALDPNYMQLPGEDAHGFRAIAERSVLADNVKDSGAVSLFPQLAGHWKSQVQAQTGWDRFRREDFENLARHFPVTWILTRRPGPAGLRCVYENRDLAVCRIAASPAGGG
ncbi:MAG: hypothetical protein LAP87_18855 [Acidobacteriia bacterium]|nr:hypothetical protein [Terriglobia bacterium]